MPSSARLGSRTSRVCRESPGWRMAIRVSSTMPVFRAPRVEEFYSVWITLECEGRAQRVFVAAGPAEQPLGYISCHLETPPQQRTIGLVGVAPGPAGEGLGSSLVLAALDWFAAQGTKEIAVVTQGRNLPAQRLYQSRGFLTGDVQLWYHKWYWLRASQLTHPIQPVLPLRAGNWSIFSGR